MASQSKSLSWALTQLLHEAKVHERHEIQRSHDPTFLQQTVTKNQLQHMICPQVAVILSDTFKPNNSRKQMSKRESMPHCEDFAMYLEKLFQCVA